MLHLLQPTYGTPVAPGFAQLRVFNGYSCDFSLELPSTLRNNDTGVVVKSLSVYEDLNIETDTFVELPYKLQGLGGECANISYSGHFHLKEKTANSYFINRTGISNFTDSTDKAIDSVRVR